MSTCREQEQCVSHNDEEEISPSQHQSRMVSQPNEATPQPQTGEGVVRGGVDEPGWPFNGEDDGGASASFLGLAPDNPQPTLVQFLSTPFPDFPLPQTSPFQFPIDPVPRGGVRFPIGNGDSAWTPQSTGHYGMMSDEVCGAVASIIPDSAEENSAVEGFLKQEVTPEQTPQSSVGMCQPGPMAVFLEPLDQLGEDVTVQELEVCQIFSCIEGEGQMVRSPSPTYTHSSSETQFQTPFPGDMADYGDSCRKDGTHSVGKTVSLTVPGSCPSLPQACLPLIRPTPALRVPSGTHGPAYNFVPGPCFSQFQTPCTLYPDIQPKMSPTRFAGTFWDAKSRRPCSCTKSQCLKLYCDCFASGYICSNCKCMNCYNNTEHDFERYQAIKTCLDRNPEAFRPKIGKGKQGEVKGRHNKGCNCKRSGCLKNYCECYEAKIMCSSICKCVSCRNYDESPERQTAVSAGSVNLADGSFYTTAAWQMKCPLACVTREIVGATCGCLLAQAEEAEKEGYTEIQAERMILEEFGLCLTQIVQSIFKCKAGSVEGKPAGL